MRSSSSHVSKQVGDIEARTYIFACYGHNRGQDEDDANEKRPGTGPDVNKDTNLPHVPRAGHKFAEDKFTAGVLLGTEMKA